MLLSTRLPALADMLERWLLLGVVAAALLGLTLSGPATAASANGGVTAALVVLVLTSAAALRPSAWRETRPALPRVAAIVLVGAAVLPAVAWLVSLLVADPVLRQGVRAAGVAPAEVASVALVAMAGGQAAITVVAVAGTVLVSVATAGPVLGLMGSSATFEVGGLLVQLLLIVGAPLLAGAAVRVLVGDRPVLLAVGRALGVLALLALLWQVSGHIQLTPAYAQATGVMALFLAASITLGWLLAAGRPHPQRVALALPVGLRDFAIAAGIATAAYGPAAATPLAGYGLLVLLYGATHARLVGRPARGPRPPDPTSSPPGSPTPAQE